MVRKLQYFLEIKNGGRRHLCSCQNDVFVPTVWEYVIESTLLSNFVEIASTVWNQRNFFRKSYFVTPVR